MQDRSASFGKIPPALLTVELNTQSTSTLGVKILTLLTFANLNLRKNSSFQRNKEVANLAALCEKIDACVLENKHMQLVDWILLTTWKIKYFI
ncbi:hypothetical protein BpHYR1_040937 [Brachionus plicatilis]|uniref:Uncharacterized protein n=1 Tax=Brachionus plicatilis TaxID=10195 RepID=A0A3M7STP3_BRAPC|nr:hypothetical protein BpHYR1_040937 [Brachionus plicatilis]